MISVHTVYAALEDMCRVVLVYERFRAIRSLTFYHLSYDVTSLRGARRVTYCLQRRVSFLPLYGLVDITLSSWPYKYILLSRKQST
jgi:hypothetical protein